MNACRSACNALDRLARGVSLRLAHLVAGELCDRRADVEDRAGPRFFSILSRSVLHLASSSGSMARLSRVHPHGFVEQPAVADLVAADDEVLPIDQIQRLELRQLR